MRRKMRISLAVLMSVGLLAGMATAQTVDEIIAKNLQAKGGVDKLKAIQTVRMTGKVSAQGMEMPMTIVSKRPNLMYQEMQIQDKKIISAFDGEKAWAINPFAGSEAPQELQGAQAEMAMRMRPSALPFQSRWLRSMFLRCRWPSARSSWNGPGSPIEVPTRS